jgi:hypothetical protein
MRSIIVSYTLEKTKPHQRIIIHRLLYGYNDLSNNGSYNYQRKGLIETCNGRKINRGVFIIPEKFENKIIPLLKKNKANLEIIPLVLH